MFHVPNDRAFVVKTLCVALAITSVFAATRLIGAEKPAFRAQKPLVRRKPIINGVVIQGVTFPAIQAEPTQLLMPKDSNAALVPVALQELITSPANSTQSNEETKQSDQQSAISDSSATVVDDFVNLPKPTIVTVRARIVTVPLKVIAASAQNGAPDDDVDKFEEIAPPVPVLTYEVTSSAATASEVENADVPSTEYSVTSTPFTTGDDNPNVESNHFDLPPIPPTDPIIVAPEPNLPPPVANPPPSTIPINATTNPTWWRNEVFQSILDRERNVSFDLETILVDTLRSSPRIQIVSRRTSTAIETIVQQDAAFDSSILFESGVGRVNDPVGSTLTTGGPPRLIDDTFDAKAGIRQTTRRGTTFDLSQELGLMNSNSTFFDPINQGNSRLSLNLTQPLLDRSGRVYNERLLTQARIDSRVSWEEMRTEVEQRIAEVMSAYWQLYELRCHLIQQADLLRRAQRIESILIGRQQFDIGRIELAKARQRVARRQDRILQLDAEVRIQQTRLASLVGSNVLYDATGGLELIPNESPNCIPIDIDLRTAVQQGLQNRPEIRAATKQLESAALTIRVTRTELEPQLNAVIDAYLAGLSGGHDVLESFGDQFSAGGPGIAAVLEYEMPRGRRAAKSRVRQAQHRFRQRSEELRETIQTTQAQIENAVTSVTSSLALQATKQRLLETAIDEETILTQRWKMMGGDGAAVGTVLESLLDAQQRRTDAEREWTTAQTQYLISLVDFQRSMGTLMIRSGIDPVQEPGTSRIHFGHPSDGLFSPGETPPTNLNTEPFVHDELGMNYETR